MIFRLLGVQIGVLVLGFWLSSRILILYGVQFYWLGVLTILGAFSVVTLELGRSLFKPLGRLLRKAKTWSQSSTVWNQNLTEEPGWWELEATLDQMHQALTQNKEELSREHQELKALLGAMSDAVLAVDNQGNSLFFNKKFASLFTGNIQSKGGVGKRLTEWFRNPEVLTSFQSAFQSGQAQSIALESHLEGEGLPRHFLLAIAPLRKKATGEVYGAIGIFHDVTTLKRAEKIRIDFVANVSHELRTPLTAIRGYTDTLAIDVKDQQWESLPDFVAAIQRNVDRLMNLINDLLDLSSLESGTMLKRQTVSTRDVSEHVVQTLDQLAKSKKHRVVVEIEPGAEKVSVDPRRLEQVLVNLVGNALKYVPSEGLIQVIWCLDAESQQVQLKVKDNGPGIPIEHQVRLFERFYRVDQARSREMGGTGLGLAIVKHIMLAHGGSASVRSALGQGAEFVCRF